MMVMTSVSERPVTEPAGTIGALVWLRFVARRERRELRVVPWLGLASVDAVVGAVRVGQLRSVGGPVTTRRRDRAPRVCAAAASGGAGRPVIRSGHGRRAAPGAALWSAASVDGRGWR